MERRGRERRAKIKEKREERPNGKGTRKAEL
jgi:hypothetical protein